MPPFVQGLGCLARAAGTLLARPRRAHANDEAASFFRFTTQSLDEQAPGRVVDTLVQAGLRGGPVGGVHRLSGLFRLNVIHCLLRTPRHVPAREHFDGDEAETGDERTGKAPLEEGALVANLRVSLATARDKTRAWRSAVRLGRFLPRVDTHTSTGGVGRIGSPAARAVTTAVSHFVEARFSAVRSFRARSSLRYRRFTSPIPLRRKRGLGTCSPSASDA